MIKKFKNGVRKIDTRMFYQGGKYDIYIGQSSGKKLLEEMSAAREKITIVSPYLSPNLIKDLIELHNRGIEIKLITVDKIDDFYNNYDEKNIYKLIIQNKKINKEALEKYKRYNKFLKSIYYLIIGIFTTGVISGVYLRNYKVLYLLILVAFFCFLYEKIRNKMKQTKIYNYDYSKLFPFKVYSTKNKEPLIHSKIYIIDDEILYLGSLNYTKSGMGSNYETRVRITDLEAIKKVKTTIYSLTNELGKGKELQKWGSEIYEEPINDFYEKINKNKLSKDDMQSLKNKLRVKNIFLFFLLFFIEIYIAKYTKNEIMRNYVGDVLVVPLIYNFIKIFIKCNSFKLIVGVLSFSILTELFQFFKIIDLLNIKNKILRIMIGNTYDLKDIISYCIGAWLLYTCVTLFQIETKFKED